MNHEYVTDWSLYPNFFKEEFRCQATGKDPIMAEEVLDFLQTMRNDLGFALPVSSGYRSPEHPIEARKSKPGEHSKGLAVDIKCYGAKFFKILDYCRTHEIKRIGIHQKGPLSGRFIHIGVGKKEDGLVNVAAWTY